MNKKNNRKGFTTVELVIVIAVIAILATVLIPTFSGLIEKANASSALQEANSAVKYITLENLDGDNNKIEGDLIIEVDGYYFGMIDGQLVQATVNKETKAITIVKDANKDYVFTADNNGSIVNLTLGKGEEYTDYVAEESKTAVDDLDTTKVTIYTLTEKK